MRRTLRQEGLVDQHKLGMLRVALCDDGENATLRSEIELMAGLLGAPAPFDYSKSVEDADFLIGIGDCDVPRDSGTPHCRVLVLDDGVRITTDPAARGGRPTPLQAAGLCTIASALAWQEIIRRTGVMLPIEIPKKYITVSLRVNPSTMVFATNPEDELVIRDAEGRQVPFTTIERDDGTGHVVLRAMFEEGSEIADAALGSLSVNRKDSEDIHSEPSEIRLGIPRVGGRISGTALIAGVGGLGSWALHALIGGASDSGHDGSGLLLYIVDPDTRVENHNLNRQVLYNDSDLGRPKAEVAVEKVLGRLPSAEAVPFVGELGSAHLYGLIHSAGDFGHDDTDDPFEDAYEDDVAIDANNLNQRSMEIFQGADAVLCGVDNLRARSMLGAMASQVKIPMINAGAQGFQGQFDLFLPDSSCMICRYGIHAVRQTVRMSCQEDGEVPFSSIVTSTAIFGALEGLALISILSDNHGSPDDWPSHIEWRGKTNQFDVESDSNFGHFSATFLKEGTHAEHLANRLNGVGGEA